MASITIRNFDDQVKTRLRVRVAGNGRSMEEEAELILSCAVGAEVETRDLVSVMRSYCGSTNRVDLELLPRVNPCARPSFRLKSFESCMKRKRADSLMDVRARCNAMNLLVVELDGLGFVVTLYGRR